MKEIPILFTRKEDCCGCSACYAICPKSAIKMVEDEEGFEYPHINEEICVRCGMCMKVCPIKETVYVAAPEPPARAFRATMPPFESHPAGV